MGGWELRKWALEIAVESCEINGIGGSCRIIGVAEEYLRFVLADEFDEHAAAEEPGEGDEATCPASLKSRSNAEFLREAVLKAREAD